MSPVFCSRLLCVGATHTRLIFGHLSLTIDSLKYFDLLAMPLMQKGREATTRIAILHHLNLIIIMMSCHYCIIYVIFSCQQLKVFISKLMKIVIQGML